MVEDEAGGDLEGALGAARRGVARHGVYQCRPRLVVGDELRGVLLAEHVERRVEVARVLEPQHVVLGHYEVVDKGEALQLDGPPRHASSNS
jgi:hypothetical protein